MAWTTDDIPRQDGRVAVVTGANGGLGLATTKALVDAGAHVVMCCRDQDKARAARDEVLADRTGVNLELVELDLGSLDSVAAAAATITAGHDRVDLLVNNAGVMAMPQGTTADGFDTQFGINHLGHWALTSHLLPTIVRTPGTRVVTVSSTAQHQGKPVDADDPHMRDVDEFDPWKMYAQSKLANRHFAVGLAAQFERAQLDARSLTCHPGLTDSDLQTRTAEAGGGGSMGDRALAFTQKVGMDEATGALSQLRAATDPDAPNGGYYGPLWGVAGPPVRKPLVRGGAVEAIRTLWEVSRRETGLDVDVEAALASPSAA